jgi:hypothetical protein
MRFAMGLVLVCVMMVVASTAYSQVDPTYDGVELSLSNAELLPDGDSAWVVHLFTSGGYTGRGLPPITVVSDGSFARGSIVPDNFKRLNAGQFASIADLVNNAELKPTKNMQRVRPREITCIDCYISRVVITRREKKKVRTYQDTEELRRYQPIAETFDRLRDLLQQMRPCE